MSRQIRLSECEDQRDAIHQVLATLAAGQIASVPDDSGSLLLCLPTRDEAVQRLTACRQAEWPAVVLLADAEMAADYVVPWPKLASRMGLRCWPGPVILTVEASDCGLAHAWSPSARDWARNGSAKSLFVPAHPFVLEMLRLAAEPALAYVVPKEHQPVAATDVPLVVNEDEIRYTAPPTHIAVREQGYEILEPGVVSERMVARLASKVFLFVCTGNTCRSPMAEALFRKMLSERLQCREDELLDHGYVVMSAGLAASPGSPASPESVDLLREKNGIDLRAHESQLATEELLMRADQVFTMTGNHAAAILSMFPELTDRVTTLSATGLDIPDPIGGGLDEYERCHAAISRELEQRLAEEL